MAQTGSRKPFGSANAWWLALCVSGAVLLALPLTVPETPVTLPPTFHEGSRSYEELMGTVAAVDQAFSAGNIQQLRSVVTKQYMDRLQQLFQRNADRPLDREALRAQGVHIGNLGKLRFLLGRSDRNRVCLAYDMARRERDGGYPVAQAVFALRFLWDGSRFRLDAKAVRKLHSGQTAEHLGERMVGEMLGG